MNLLASRINNQGLSLVYDLGLNVTVSSLTGCIPVYSGDH